MNRGADLHGDEGVDCPLSDMRGPSCLVNLSVTVDSVRDKWGGGCVRQARAGRPPGQ